MASIDAHLLGCFADVAVKLGELVKYEFPVIRIGRGFERGKAKARCGFLVRRAELGKLRRSDLCLRRHDHHALDRVLQLAHVSEPLVFL